MPTGLKDVLNALETRADRHVEWSSHDAQWSSSDDIADELLESDTSAVESLLEEAATQGLIEKRAGSYDPEYRLTREGSMRLHDETT